MQHSVQPNPLSTATSPLCAEGHLSADRQRPNAPPLKQNPANCFRSEGANHELGILALCALPAHAGTLTDRMAQRALDQWLPGNGQKSVVGVVEIPAQSAARADIVLSNFAWMAPQNDAITAYAMGPGGGRQIFNGRGTAVFAHYTDGRWVLVRIETPMGNWENLNIAAR